MTYGNHISLCLLAAFFIANGSALAEKQGWRTLEEQATALSIEGKYSEALPIAERALAAGEKALGADHPDVATLLYQLARIHEELGQYIQAESIRKRILDIEEKRLGPNSTSLVYALMNLAGNYMDQKKHALAEPLYKRLLAIQERAYGVDNLNIITPLNALATLYRAQGKYDLAETHIKRVLRLWEQTEGPQHTAVAISMENLAALSIDQGKYADAESLYVRALKIKENAVEKNGMDPDYRELANCLEKIALLYRKTGRESEAKKFEERVATIRAKVDPEPLIRLPKNWGQRQ